MDKFIGIGIGPKPYTADIQTRFQYWQVIQNAMDVRLHLGSQVPKWMGMRTKRKNLASRDDKLQFVGNHIHLYETLDAGLIAELR